MDGDPEALVERLLGGDAQHARELVPQRTAAVGLDVRGRQRQADPLARQERPQRVRSPSGPASARLRVRSRRPPVAHRSALGEQRLVERRGLEDLALQRRGGREQARVDVRQRLGDALPARALKQGGELEQLQVAHHPVGDVQVGVQPQLAETPADPRDARRAPPRASAGASPRARPPPAPARADRLVARRPEALAGARHVLRRASRPAGIAPARDGALSLILATESATPPPQVTGQLARRRPRLAADELGRQLAQPLEARPLLGRVVRARAAGARARPGARSAAR